MIAQSADTLQNVVLASGIALMFVLFRHGPALTRLVFPFYKQGDCTKAGFIPFGQALMRFGIFRGYAYSRFVLPIFATIYIVVLLLRETLTLESSLTSTTDFYFMVGMWALIVLMTGNAALMLLITGVPFGIGFMLSQTIYGGCVAAAIVLAWFYAVAYEEHYAYDLVLNRVEAKEGVHLDGSPSKPFVAKLRYVFRVLTPLFMLITIVRIVLSSKFSSSEFVLTYVDSTTENLFAALLPLMISINISFRLFSRKIFSYLQIDFLRILGERLLFSRENPEKFNEEEKLIEQQMNTATGSKYEGPLLSLTDRMPPVDRLPVATFSTAISFFALDLILTLSAQLSFPIIPGTTSANIATLSSILKIPLYIVFISSSTRRLLTSITSNSYLELNSATYREEAQEQREILHSLENLLRGMIKQQIARKDYINISGNKYLLTLAGMDDRKRIHI